MPSALRILTTCADVAVIQREAAAFQRSAVVEAIAADSIRRLEPAACLVVEAAEDARIARATGFDGAIIVLGVAANGDESEGMLAQGTRFVPRDDVAGGLAGALAEAVDLDANGSVVAAPPAVARVRRLVAAGELAVALRHALNNPLTALMAEIQLLQLEARDEDGRAAAGRMLDLVRRLTEMSRSLESVRDR
jgi:signal transduction histidine kinase